MAQPEAGQDIVSFSSELGYPDVETFMTLNSDKVRQTDTGTPYVLAGVDYPEFQETQTTETAEVTDDSAKAGVDAFLTTTNMTLAEPQPGVETFNIQKQDPRLDVQNEVMRQQEENLPTLDMPEAVAEPPAQMTVGEEVVSVQDVPGPTPEVPEMVPEDAQKVLAGEPLKEPEAKPAEAEGARAIGIASTIMPEADGTRTITEEELKAYPMKVQQVVDNFFDEGGYTFFDESAELPFKADIDKVDERIKALDDRLNQISNEQIKPYFGKEDTGRKIFAAIAAGLGAYASAMSGTPNYALQILNKAIDDDLEKQKTEMAFKRQTINDQRLLLTEKRQELLTMAEMQLNKAATMATSAQQQQKLKIMLTEVLLNKDSNDQKLRMELVSILQKRFQAQREGIVPNMGAKPGEDGMTSLTGDARKAVIKKAMGFNFIYNEANSTVRDLQEILEENRLQALGPQALSATRSEVVQRMNNLKVMVAKQLYEFGAALTANEEKLLDNVIADASRANISLGVTRNRLNTFMDILETKRKAIRDSGNFKTMTYTQGTAPQTQPQTQPQTGKKLPKSAQVGVVETF